jgi:uncharacterized protein RhaS with RHS repeats
VHFKARGYLPSMGRFLQPDPIGIADDLNMYSDVGNDPVNKNDPSGTTCKVTGSRVRQAHCWVDTITFQGKKSEEEKDRLRNRTNPKIGSINRAYSNTVTHLLSDPNRKFPLVVSGKTMIVTSGAVADALAKARVNIYTENTKGKAFANAVGGPGSSVYVPVKTINLFPAGISGSALGEIGATLVHEAIHLIPDGYVLRPNSPGFNDQHQDPFNDAASNFLRNCRNC